MKPIANIGRVERDVIAERRAFGYRDGDGDLVVFGEVEGTLRALLACLLPGVAESVDLVGFVDRHADAPLGRGDRPEGSLPTGDLLVNGVETLAALGFGSMSEAERHDTVRRLRVGDTVQGLADHGKEFIDRLLEKALQGYLAHPDTWERIGFNGPAYPEGYAWIGTAEVTARHDRATGWNRL